jgi:predicted nucleic-acid-binding Zn-ribbon protein
MSAKLLKTTLGHHAGVGITCDGCGYKIRRKTARHAGQYRAVLASRGWVTTVENPEAPASQWGAIIDVCPKCRHKSYADDDVEAIAQVVGGVR